MKISTSGRLFDRLPLSTLLSQLLHRFQFNRASHSLLGPYDPFGLRFECKIVDAEGKEHRSAERYFWFVSILTVLRYVYARSVPPSTIIDNDEIVDG